MRRTKRHAAHPEGFLGATLKVVILRSQFCIGFAGDIGRAIEAIRQVDVALGAGGEFDQVEAILLKANRTAGRCEPPSFIVGRLKPAALTWIRDGMVSPDVPNAWVGDHKAFEVFQTEYIGGGTVPPEFAAHFPDGVPGETREAVRTAQERTQRMMAEAFADTPGAAEDMRVAYRSHAAMDAVIGSGLKSVGESAIFVATRPPLDPHHFAYLERSGAHAEQGLNHPDTGTPASGSFSFAVLTPRNTGIAAVGIYFVEGRLGLLHHPLTLDYPRAYRNTTIDEFKAAVRADLDLELVGM